MLFNSFDFVIFFVIVWIGQAVLPFRPRNTWLLAASCFFYGYWDWRFLGLMWVTITVDYLVSHAIARSEAEVVRRRWLAVSVATNLGILCWFKYAGFFADSFEQAARTAGLDLPHWVHDVVLPLGISFYTFQSMSYVFDVYKRRMQPLARLDDYGLYVTLFPQLVAGPIERGSHLAAQVMRKTVPVGEDVYQGGWLILKGLFKKVVIADNLAPVVDGLFSLSQPTGGEVLIGVYAFAFQIYGDFSGYTDMARGIAKWMGYDLMLNFRLPYFATSPSDFWQRWHISLSSWLRDYLYIPLGGNRRGEFRTNVNLMLTMLLGGLWHGAAWNFVLWGAFHGLLLMAFRPFEKTMLGVCRVKGTLAWALAVGVMFHLVCYSWLLFRAESLEQIAHMTRALLSDWSMTETAWRGAWALLILAGPLMTMQLAQELTGNLNLVRHLSVPSRSIIYAAVMLAILALGNFGGQDFVYFQF